MTTAFHSHKGGTGKTSMLLNVAANLVRSGCRVGILDLDTEAPGLAALYGLDTARHDLLWLLAKQPPVAEVESHIVQGVQILWGVWLFPFGLLVYQSRFIPKIFGVLVMIAGFAYVLSSFMSIVLPQYKATASPFISILVLAELPIIFWLLIVGAKAQTEERQSQS